MIRISELLLNFALNAGWQLAVIFVVASIGSNLLKNAAANFRHALWLVALGLSLVVPFWTVGFSPNVGRATNIGETRPSLTRSISANPPQVTAEHETDTALIDRLVAPRKQVV